MRRAFPARRIVALALALGAGAPLATRARAEEPAAPPPRAPADEAAALALGRAIEQSFTDGTVFDAPSDSPLLQALDGGDVVMARALDPLRLAPDDRAAAAAAHDAVPLLLAREIVKTMRDATSRATGGAAPTGAWFRLIRFREIDGEPTLLFRHHVRPGKTAAYFELPLVPGEGGGWVVADILRYQNGHRLSDLIRLSVLRDQARAGALPSLREPDVLYVVNLERIDALESAPDAQVMDAFRALPASLRERKELIYPLLHRVRGAAFGELFESLRANDPENPAWAFMAAADVLGPAGETDRALAELDGLQERIGEEAYLEVLRGRALAKGRRLADAVAAYQRAVALDATLREAHVELIGAALAADDFEAVSAALTGAEAALETRFDDLEKRAAFADYVKSDAYRRWLASREKK